MDRKRFRETGYSVPRLEHHIIRERAQRMIDLTAHIFGQSNEPVPIVDLIEFFGSDPKLMLPDYEIVDDNSIPGFIAKYSPESFKFTIAQSCWDSATDGDGESRYHLAHELGHYALNHPSAAFGRQFHNDIVIKLEDSEHQANLFADEYLMDVRHMHEYRDPERMVSRFGVDERTACRRIRDLTREGFWGKRKQR